ncbi:DUF7522 family protein [Halogeometricum limi]|uniref:Uncharacterized protein n=1 Tax=Halogeometricum limi TaxID=555875 RepID=A0A1I6IM98_9EURY|nr:hypothetical protein SAMN04488124_3400 [Halogeometricum limi]
MTVEYGTGIEAAFADQLVSAARTGLGDTLRSVVYFTPSSFDLLYLRGDLYESPEDARPAKARLVEFETAASAVTTLLLEPPS